LDNNVPLELQDDVFPENKLEQTISETLKTNELLSENISIENHPKINSLENKLAILEVDRKLKANSLLPKMDVGYHYLSEPNYWNDTNFNNYKVGINFSFPLFLRKERGSLQLAKFKIQDAQLSLNFERLQLKNKINAQQTELESITKQRKIISEESTVAGQAARKAVREKEEEQIATMQKAGIAITRPDVAPFRDKMAPAYDILRKSIGDENWANWSRAVAAART
jgi:hypothetical protein